MLSKQKRVTSTPRVGVNQWERYHSLETKNSLGKIKVVDINEKLL
jgi:hypothetical protein